MGQLFRLSFCKIITRLAAMQFELQKGDVIILYCTSILKSHDLFMNISFDRYKTITQRHESVAYVLYKALACRAHVVQTRDVQHQ